MEKLKTATDVQTEKLSFTFDFTPKSAFTLGQRNVDICPSDSVVDRTSVTLMLLKCGHKNVEYTGSKDKRAALDLDCTKLLVSSQACSIFDRIVT